MPDLFGELADYISALQRGAANTTRAEERPVYTRRLAAAAEMFVALHRGDHAELKRLIDQEEHSVGWGYLEGNDGAAADSTFAAFVTRARVSGATSAA
jgi:hypothetical protein